MSPAFFYYKRPYLPHIARFFTALVGFVCIVGVLGGSLWLFYNLKLNTHVYAKKSVQEGQLSSFELQKNYDWWKKTIEKQPDYLDGYIMTSYYAHALGKQEEALSLLTRALVIDPNNGEIHRQVQEIQYQKGK